MIVPPWIYVAGGAGLLAVGAWTGWTANDWRHDSKALDALANATKSANDAARHMRDQGDKFEESRSNEQASSTVRESTINTIYRDRPVPADCAVPDDVGSVLDDAIAAANARRAGQPGSRLPTDPASAGP